MNQRPVLYIDVIGNNALIHFRRKEDYEKVKHIIGDVSTPLDHNIPVLIYDPIPIIRDKKVISQF